MIIQLLQLCDDNDQLRFRVAQAEEAARKIASRKSNTKVKSGTEKIVSTAGIPKIKSRNSTGRNKVATEEISSGDFLDVDLYESFFIFFLTNVNRIKTTPAGKNDWE